MFSDRNRKLFDTPAAIARVVRSSAYQKRMVVRAAPSKAGSQQALSYRWVVLRGDPMRIQIKPRRSDGSEAELIVAWHERRSIADRPELTTDRVDIGVFAHNGRHFSAPSFISFVYPARQKRDYDDQNRIVSIDYFAPEFANRAVDMRVFYDRAWRDAKGRLVGWRRLRGNGEAHYTRHGARVSKRDSRGRAVKAQVVGYQPKQRKKGQVEIIEVPVNKFLTYRYSGDADRLGEVR